MRAIAEIRIAAPTHERTPRGTAERVPASSDATIPHSPRAKNTKSSTSAQRAQVEAAAPADQRATLAPFPTSALQERVVRDEVKGLDSATASVRASKIAIAAARAFPAACAPFAMSEAATRAETGPRATRVACGLTSIPSNRKRKPRLLSSNVSALADTTSSTSAAPPAGARRGNAHGKSKKRPRQASTRALPNATSAQDLRAARDAPANEPIPLIIKAAHDATSAPLRPIATAVNAMSSSQGTIVRRPSASSATRTFVAQNP